MSWVADVLGALDVTGRDHGTSFPDGAAFRIEIPSVEGPGVLEAVLRAAEAEGITVNRVSQGSGAMLMRAVELRDMAQAAREAGVEVCLFVGPRERYGVGAHARSEDGRAHADQVRGLRQISYALEDVLRATEAGIRSFLVADLGLLRAMTQAQAQGSLPAGLVWKVSAAMSPSNPVTVKLLEDLGGLLFAGYYVVISLYSIWYYRTVLFRDLREFVLGLLLPLVGAATLVYVIVKSLPGTPVPVRIIALVLFLVGIPLAFLSKAITHAPFFAARRESYSEERAEPLVSELPGGAGSQVMPTNWIQRRTHSAKKASRSPGSSPTTSCS